MLPSLPVVLCILDGWGSAPPSAHNSISLAQTPTWDRFLTTYPHSQLDASSHAVGLPQGQMGNSEVGHMTIGAGRIIMQDLPRIDQGLSTGDIFNTSTWHQYLKQLKTTNGVCHVMGLLSPGGIHAHTHHWWLMLEQLHQENIPVRLHIFLDGRDTPPQSAVQYLTELDAKMVGWPLCQWGTMGGRYYGMDRDQRWDRIAQAYQGIAKAEGPRFNDPLAYLKNSYDQQITDEFVHPAVYQTYKGIQAGDNILMMNFRADRVRQLLSALIIPDFTHFDVENLSLVACLGLTEYATTLSPYMNCLFTPQPTEAGLGELVAMADNPQLRAAETEKYAHVTFFLNGGREAPYEQEDRVMIPSPAVATYDQQPEMSALALTDAVRQAIQSEQYRFIVVNFANADMVGHTGNIPAAIKAVETLDQTLAMLEQDCLKHDHWLLVTADHENVEMMIDEHTAAAHTAHTCNTVPCVLVGNHTQHLHLQHGGLQDIAPTVLACLGLTPSSLMTGKNLITSS